MDCFGTCFTHAQTSDVKPPCKRPRSPLQRWRQPLSSPLQAPLTSPLQAPSKPPSPSEGFKPPWRLVEAPFKPPSSPLEAFRRWSPLEAPFKPPWSPLQAPFKPLEAPFIFGRLQAPLKPPWSPLEAFLQAPLKPPWSPLQAPLNPPWSPLEAFRRWSPLRPSDLRRPFKPPWRGLLKGVLRNQPPLTCGDGLLTHLELCFKDHSQKIAATLGKFKQYEHCNAMLIFGRAAENSLCNTWITGALPAALYHWVQVSLVAFSGADTRQGVFHFQLDNVVHHIHAHRPTFWRAWITVQRSRYMAVAAFDYIVNCMGILFDLKWDTLPDLWRRLVGAPRTLLWGPLAKRCCNEG